jgi:hypothetical protein
MRVAFLIAKLCGEQEKALVKASAGLDFFLYSTFDHGLQLAQPIYSIFAAYCISSNTQVASGAA